MLNPYFSIMMLGMESANVVGLRMFRMACGGKAALDEVRLMIDEKLAASWEAATILVGGGNAFGVIDRYRDRVADNAERLVVQVTAKLNHTPGSSDDEVSRKAYEIWNERGRTHGHDGEDWLLAASACSIRSAGAGALS